MTNVVILCATGNLAASHLLPALAQLRSSGLAPQHLNMTGVGHQGWRDDRRLQDDAAQARTRQRPGATRDQRLELCNRLRYIHGDAPAADELRPVLAGATEGPLVHLALPHQPFLAVADVVPVVGLPAGARVVVVEKPFGESREDEIRLDTLVHTAGPGTRSSGRRSCARGPGGSLRATDEAG